MPDPAAVAVRRVHDLTQESFDRVTQWIPRTGGWTISISDSDGPYTEVELDTWLRVTGSETRDDVEADPRAHLHVAYATSELTRTQTSTLESVDGELDDRTASRESTVSADGMTTSHEAISVAPNGESTRSVRQSALETWTQLLELRDDDDAVIAELNADGLSGGRSTTLGTWSGAEHVFSRDAEAMTATWALPASDRCDTHDDCVPADCGLLCQASALCVDGACANGLVQPVVSTTFDHDGRVRSIARPGGVEITFGYLNSVCFPEGGTCSTDADCTLDGQCLQSEGVAPAGITVTGDGARPDDNWSMQPSISGFELSLYFTQSSQSPDGIENLQFRDPDDHSAGEVWRLLPTGSPPVEIGVVTVDRAYDDTLLARTVHPDGSSAVHINGMTLSGGRVSRLRAISAEVESAWSLLDGVPSTVATRISAGELEGVGVFESTFTDDFGRTTLRTAARAPVATAPDDCATFMATAEGSGIYCEELDYDPNGRIVAHTTRINEHADAEPAEVDAWAYAYTPGDGRLASATLNGTQGAEYAWSANGTLEALNRNITGLAPRAIGGTDVEIDDQDRLWRFGDIRYGYTPDGRATWRRERSSDGTERLLCLDYDVFSGLRGAQWITEGSGEELGCDEVEEFDGEVDYQLDSGGRRIVTDRTVGEVTAATSYFVYGDALHPIARLDAQRRLAQMYVFRDGAHTPTAMVAYTYTGEDVQRTTFAFVNDPRGSVRMVVRLDDGEVVQRLDYGPFGEVILDTSPGFQPFGYAGGLYDADTGLVRFGARDYDAETGRWLTRDPIGFAAGDANLYAYVGGDPVNSVDPTGLQGCAGGPGDPAPHAPSPIDYICTVLEQHPSGGFVCNVLTLPDNLDDWREYSNELNRSVEEEFQRALSEAGVDVEWFERDLEQRYQDCAGNEAGSDRHGDPCKAAVSLRTAIRR